MTPIETEIRAIVQEYSQQGGNYTLRRDDKYINVDLNVINRALTMQLIALCDRRKLQCFITADTKEFKAHVSFVIIQNLATE